MTLHREVLETQVPALDTKAVERVDPFDVEPVSSDLVAPLLQDLQDMGLGAGIPIADSPDDRLEILVREGRDDLRAPEGVPSVINSNDWLGQFGFQCPGWKVFDSKVAAAGEKATGSPSQSLTQKPRLTPSRRMAGASNA